MKSTHDSPILVTGAAGDIGAIGRNLTAMLLFKLTGKTPMSMYDFVKLHAAEFTQSEATA